MVLVTDRRAPEKRCRFTCLNILNNPESKSPPRKTQLKFFAWHQPGGFVDDRQGLTFPGRIESILRQDPDIIMVGEIRDLETAEIAIKAAQTGHMVCQRCTRMMRRRRWPFDEHGHPNVQHRVERTPQ